MQRLEIIIESTTRECSLHWSLAAPEFTREATVITYDQGYGKSPFNQLTCAAYVNDLRALLKTISAQPPYLLVGQGLGEKVMKLFAAEYPEEVIGLVVIDSTNEGTHIYEKEASVRRRECKGNAGLFKPGSLLSLRGIIEGAKRLIGSKRSPSARRELPVSEERAIVKPLRPDLPVFVLRTGEPYEEWPCGSLELNPIMNKTRHKVVDASWPAIHIHQPQPVRSAIRELMDEHSLNCCERRYGY